MITNLDREREAFSLLEDPVKMVLLPAGHQRQHRGEPTGLSVRIINVSSSPVMMVGVLPGSDGLRYPLYIAEVEGPAGPVQLRFPEDLDYVRGLRVHDFVSLAPGEDFDPEGNGFIPIQQWAWFQSEEPGLYRFRLCFDATIRDSRKWLGHARTTDQTRVEELIRQVPPIKIWSNTVEIDFD